MIFSIFVFGKSIVDIQIFDAKYQIFDGGCIKYLISISLSLYIYIYKYKHNCMYPPMFVGGNIYTISCILPLCVGGYNIHCETCHKMIN